MSWGVDAPQSRCRSGVKARRGLLRPPGRHKVQSGQGGEGRPCGPCYLPSPAGKRPGWDGRSFISPTSRPQGEGAGGSSLERAGRVWGEGAWQLQEGSSWHEAGGSNAGLGRSGMCRGGSWGHQAGVEGVG